MPAGTRSDATLPPALGEIEFRLLGTLTARAGERTVTPGPGRTGALLALLLLHAGEVVASERIVEDLLRAPAVASSAGYAKVHVARLRKALSPLVSGGGAGAIVQTRAPGYVLLALPDQIDAHRFEALVAGGRERLACGDPAEAARRLAAGLELWHDPLAEFAYEPFAQTRIARLRELHAEALELRAEADLALGHHAEVVAELERLAAEHPYREHVHRHLMLALYRCGRQADALAAYRALRATLIEDIGIEPGHELRSLEHAILTQDPALGWAPPADAGAEPVAPKDRLLPAALTGMLPPRFIDRTDELGRLTKAWSDARAGRPCAVLVTGETGIGKTRIAARLAGLAHEDGATVLYGRCDEDVPRACGAWLDALDDPAAVRGDGRQELFPAVFESLRRACRRGPVLLVLDDLHVADDDTVALLRYVMRAARAIPLLVLAAYRDCELDEDAPLARALADLHRAGAASLALRALSDRDIQELVEAAGGREQVAPQIARASGGNPLFALELAASRTGFGTDALPDGVQELAGARVRRLGHEVTVMLRIAAVMGQEFELDALARVWAGDPLGGLEAAVAAGVLAEPAGRPGRFRFTHEVIRWTLRGQLGPARRHRLEKRLADAPAV